MKTMANGVAINYQIEGRGPWVVMSHSLACALAMWEPQVGALESSYRVLRFDTRGHGGSDAPAGDLHAGADGGRPARAAGRAEGGAPALRWVVHGRDDRHDLRAQVPGRVAQPRAVRHHQSHAVGGATGVGRADPDRERAGHGAAGGTDAEALVHRAVPRAAAAGGRPCRADDPLHAATGLRRLLPRHPSDRPHASAEGDRLSGADHRRRTGRRHAGGDVARDPRRDAGVGAGDHSERIAPVESRAARRRSIAPCSTFWPALAERLGRNLDIADALEVAGAASRRAWQAAQSAKRQTTGCAGQMPRSITFEPSNTSQLCRP